MKGMEKSAVNSIPNAKNVKNMWVNFISFLYYRRKKS